MKVFTKLAAIAAMLFASASVLAIPVIDQNQDNNPNYMAAFSQSDLAQSFEQSNGNITGAGIFLQENIGSTDMVTISLWDALPNAGGNMLATASALGMEGTWVDVFWNAVNVSANTTYYLVFTSENDTLGVSGDVNNPYGLGQVFANPGFQGFANFDYTFRTYYENDAQVSEPMGIALLGLGMVMLGAMRRRK